jgi:hypothetical protein
MSRVPLGEDVPLPPPGLGRIELAWILSRAAWMLTGAPLPEIPRSELPIRRVRKLGQDG